VQVISLVLYILTCKIFRRIKMMRNKDGKLDEKDPFQSELAKTNEDFMARDNFFMEILII
jgi:hypothetical protein